MRRLNTYVHVEGAWYGPDSTVPDDVAEKITNPKVWADEKSSIPDAAEEVKEPPRKGPGSGGPAWIAFAASKGVTDSFESKEALIAHLEDNGHIEKA